jgi:hypothetical protein
MEEEQRQEKTSMPHEVRDDLWWISSEYMTAACHMIAWQFIDSEEPNYTDRDVFVERLTYVMRQHVPILYSYFFTIEGVTTIPMGTVNIILNIIRQHRPMFLPSGGVILGS